MRAGRKLVFASLLGVALVGPALLAQTPGAYREYRLGSNLESVAALAGVPATDAKVVHERPALTQELSWRRPYVSRESGAAIDPVEQIVFSFYNDRLYRLVIDYDRQQTEGLTDGDVIDAISSMYGASVTAAATAGARSQIEKESGTRVARWGGAEYSAVLYRSDYSPGFRLIVTSVRLAASARAADARAEQLDEREGPQRERARQKKEAEDARTRAEKSRVANKSTFVP